jgi:hypothetical protein
MAITATTLSSAVGANDQFITLASVTGVTTPNLQQGTGITWLKIDEEYLFVVNVPSAGTTIQVLRGQLGSGSVAHVANSQVQIGLPSDFPSQQSKPNTLEAVNGIFGGLTLPAVFLAGATDAIPAGVAATYVVKSTAINAMTLAAPTAAQEGNIIMILSDTLFAHTLTATALLANGTALKTTATFPAFRGACLVLRVCNLVYHVISNGASAGVVVLT